jgi:wobble nucleotide-excising tRNase
MLIRIVRLNHVGLFRTDVVNVPQLQKVTAFYGENGRGKSTLSAVLDSCSRGKPSLVQCRATIDEGDPAPHIELIFDGGARGNVQFTGGAWSVARPDIVVFDSQFVHDNVYTGLEVTSENRKGLYEFALGDQAAVLQQLDALQIQSQEALRRRRQHEEALRPNVGPYSISDFIALEPNTEIEELLRAARQRVQARRESTHVQARQDLLPLEFPGEFSLSVTVAQLNRTIEDLNQEAVALVRAHFANHPERGLEEWVNRGRVGG